MASLRVLLMLQCSVLLLWLQLASAKNSTVHPSPPPKRKPLVANCTVEGYLKANCTDPNTLCIRLYFGTDPIFTCLCKDGYARALGGQGCQKKYDPDCDPSKVRDGCLAPPPIINESFPRSKFNKIVAGTCLSIFLLLVTSFTLGK